MKEDGETAVLRNEAGETVTVDASILRDNELVVAEGRVMLPRGVYEHYYGAVARETAARREALEVRLLERNAAILRAHEEVILASPEWAEVASTAWVVGGVPAGRVGYLTLGLLLTLWHDPRFQRTCPECGGTGYVYRIAGSFLSGRNHATAVCPACARSFAQECRAKECSLGRMVRTVEEVGRRRGGVWVLR
ncbi:MAG: hypothetical protein ACOC1U_06965 [Spirochaetota bacterium]